MKTISYLRVSTLDQDTEKFKADVLRFCNEKDYGKVKFVEEKVSGKKHWRERKIKAIFDELGKGDKLIVPELSRLGRSTLEVLEILKEASNKGVSVYSVKEAFQLNGKGMQAKILATMLALFADIEREFISSRTREGLAAAKKKGKLLGRPKGPGKSKLDKFRPEIEALLKNGATKAFIARRYKTSLVNLYNWLKKNKINIEPEL